MKLPLLTVRRSIATYLAESPAFARLVYACLFKLSALREVSFCLSGGLLNFPFTSRQSENQSTSWPGARTDQTFCKDMTFLLQQVNNLLALPMFARHPSY
jgi:hypothetical protein